MALSSSSRLWLLALGSQLYPSTLSLGSVSQLLALGFGSNSQLWLSALGSWLYLLALGSQLWLSQASGFAWPASNPLILSHPNSTDFLLLAYSQHSSISKPIGLLYPSPEHNFASLCYQWFAWPPSKSEQPSTSLSIEIRVFFVIHQLQIVSIIEDQLFHYKK